MLFCCTRFGAESVAKNSERSCRKSRGGVSGRRRPRHRGGAIRPDGCCDQREREKGGECPGQRSEPTIGTVAGEARKRQWKRARLLGAVVAASRRSLLDCHDAGLLGADGARGSGSPKSYLCVAAEHELVKAVAPCSVVELPVL